MSTIIQDTVLSYLPSKRSESNGWVTHNAVCCVHNGESPDTRRRGHIKVEGTGKIIYGCFNCGFKAFYEPGQQLNYKFRKWLKWLQVDESTVNRLVFEALREKDEFQLTGRVAAPNEEIKLTYKKMPLPEGAVSFTAMAAFDKLSDGGAHFSPNFINAISYTLDRNVNIAKYEFYWADQMSHRMNKRVIIPFTWMGEIIGYTARAFDEKISPKYHMQVDEGYVFNLDMQDDAWQFVIVTEGPFDAMAIDCAAVLHNVISNKQVEALESLNREIIVVPHWDSSGGGLIDAALQNGWSVSFPVWSETCKDISEAVKKYGKLFVLKDIIDNVERSSLKIKLKRK